MVANSQICYLFFYLLKLIEVSATNELCSVGHCCPSTAGIWGWIHLEERAGTFVYRNDASISRPKCIFLLCSPFARSLKPYSSMTTFWVFVLLTVNTQYTLRDACWENGGRWFIRIILVGNCIELGDHICEAPLILSVARTAPTDGTKVNCYQEGKGHTGFDGIWISLRI